MSALRLRLASLLFAFMSMVAIADVPPGTDARDTALLARMTPQEKINQLMLLSKGTMTGPDSAGRPNLSAEELARSGYVVLSPAWRQQRLGSIGRCGRQR